MSQVHLFIFTLKFKSLAEIWFVGRVQFVNCPNLFLSMVIVFHMDAEKTQQIFTMNHEIRWQRIQPIKLWNVETIAIKTCSRF